MSGEMIHPDIRMAQTLPSRFYTAPEEFKRLKGAFKGWQFVAHAAELEANTVLPVGHMEAMTGEPILLVKGEDTRCLSNICTHRGMRLVPEPCAKSTLQCRYHGRTFDLDGTLRHMPEFEQAIGFPSKADHLHRFPLQRWMGLYFTAMEDAPLEGLGFIACVVKSLVEFRVHVRDMKALEVVVHIEHPVALQGAGSVLDTVEHQDQWVIEEVQKSMASMVYDRGRYSPTREQGVHHFHRMIDRFLS